MNRAHCFSSRKINTKQTSPQIYNRYSLRIQHSLFQRKALFNQRGDVADAIQILHNGANFIPRDALAHPLGDGDQITFMMMMAGG